MIFLLPLPTLIFAPPSPYSKPKKPPDFSSALTLQRVLACSLLDSPLDSADSAICAESEPFSESLVDLLFFAKAKSAKNISIKATKNKRDIFVIYPLWLKFVGVAHDKTA